MVHLALISVLYKIGSKKVILSHPHKSVYKGIPAELYSSFILRNTHYV